MHKPTGVNFATNYCAKNESGVPYVDAEAVLCRLFGSFRLYIEEVYYDYLSR